MDFRTKVDNQVFGVRATALVMRNHQLYLCKSPKGKYYTVGGAIQVGERAEDAVRREVFEEIGVEIEVQSLAFIVENHFEIDGTSFHQVEFHFIVHPLGEPADTLVEGDSSRSCEWHSLEDLAELDLNPAFLKTELAQWDGQVKHFVNVDEK